MALIRSGVEVKRASGINPAFRFGRTKFNRRAACGTDKPGLAAMPGHGKTPVGTDHEPGCLRKGQRMASRRRATDLTCLPAPDCIMTMAWPDQGMGDLMKNGVTNMVRFCVTDIMARQRDRTVCVVALAGTPARMVKLHCPTFKTMLTHKLSGRFQRRLQRTVSWLHAAPAI